MDCGMMRLAKGMDRQYATIHPRTRFSYWLAFGVSPDEQIAIESELEGVDLAWHLPQPEGNQPAFAFSFW
jgi:hypothetical protein